MEQKKFISPKFCLFFAIINLTTGKEHKNDIKILTLHLRFITSSEKPKKSIERLVRLPADKNSC